MSVLVVTGGSRGIGGEICRLAGSRGWSVCVNFAAAEDAAKSVVQEIEAAGGRAISVRGDVANEADVENVFREATDRLSPVTGLVNNAGIMGSGGPVDELDRDLTRRMFDVNLLGPFLCCKAAIRRMATIALCLLAAPVEIVRAFGSREGYIEAVCEIENHLYTAA